MTDETTPHDAGAMPPASLGSVARPNWFAFMAWAKSVALYSNAGKKLPANLATKHEIAWSAWKSSRRQAVTDCRLTNAAAMPPASNGSGAKCRPIGAYVHAPTYDDLLAEIDRLRLTDKEREAITLAAGDSSQWGRPHARVLLRLLERTK